MSCILFSMVLLNFNYDIICSVELWSHLVPGLIGWFISYMNNRGVKKVDKEPLIKVGVDGKVTPTKVKKNKDSMKANNMPVQPSLAMSIGVVLIILLSPPLCLYTCRLLSNPTFLSTLIQNIPIFISNTLQYMFPISELSASYNIICSFVSDKELLHDMIVHLLFVTFHIQVSLGHIGIAFLTSEQRRKNMLIRMDVDEKEDVGGSSNKVGKKKGNGVVKEKKFDPSAKFRRSAPTFILFTVLPYMFQIILFGNLNKFAFIQVQNQIHRSVRIHELFDHDSHLTALASDSATSPDVYASSMDTVVSTSYDMFNRKLFSLPKLIILPGVIARQPMLLIKIFPIIFITDMLKGRIVASVTDKVEELQRGARDVNSVRQKVEQFDLKNAELLRRSGTGATRYTQRRWDELTLEYQALMAAGDILRRTRGFFLWLQRNFVFVVLIDCALSKLLAEGSIVVAEIFVFSRAIEDVVDLLLIRSRSESELATLMTQVEKLSSLDEVWSKSKEARLLPCNIGSTSGIELSNLQYSRGTASVNVEQLVLEPGVYAVTGANGSGKSTLFRLLMACKSNERPIDLHESIVLGTPAHQWDFSDDSCTAPDSDECKVNQDEASGEMTSITLPSSDIVEISQTFYWPLYSKPIDWIHQKHITSDLSESERKECVKRVAEELQSLSFAQSQEKEEDSDGESEIKDTSKSNGTVIDNLMVDLQEEKEDWFNELSGGQKSKVELVRKVFLRDECPSVLLVDETMAPLDPTSKSQVMSKLKAFCNRSVVLVIYHTDVGRVEASDDDTSEAAATDVECVPSNNFFDHNLHVVDKHLTTRPVC